VGREFDELLTRYHEEYDKAVSRSENEEDLAFSCDLIRNRYLDLAIDCAKTLKDCAEVQINLFTDDEADEGRNFLLKEKLERKILNIEEKNKILTFSAGNK